MKNNWLRKWTHSRQSQSSEFTLAQFNQVITEYRLQPLDPKNSCRDANIDFQLLYVGDLTPQQQLPLLIESLLQLRLLSGRNIRLQLIIDLTPSDALAQLQQQIAARALHTAVDLIDSCSDQLTETSMARYYQQADFYLSLNRQALADRGMLQAITHRRPIVSCQQQNSVDATGKTSPLYAVGLRVNTEDPLQIAATLLQLMDNPRLRSQLADQACTALLNYQQQEREQKQQEQLQKDPQNTPPSVNSELAYRIEGPFDSSYSLAMVNRELARGLAQQHPEKVGLYSTEGPGDYAANPAFLQQNADCVTLNQRGDKAQAVDVTLRLLYPPRVTAMQGRYNGLGCYGWEESSIPMAYIRQFNQQLHFSTTMSEYVTRTMIDNGVNCPLFTTGIGVDHILQATPDSTELPELPDALRFLHISSCFPRKGADVLLQAYGAAFSGDDNVCLIIKTFPNPHHDIAQQLTDWQASLQHAPPVILINQDLSDGAIRALYQAADALVGPSRGEGFGLPMAEAMLHRLPVITTGYGGQRDFCHDDNAWLIDYDFARAQTHMGQASSVWVDPKAAHLTEILQHFYQQYAATEIVTPGIAAAENEAAAAPQVSIDRCAAKQRLANDTKQRLDTAERYIQQHYSWQHVAAKTDQSVKRLPHLPVFAPQAKLGVLSTWHTKCGIAAYSEMLLAPALSHAHIFANDNLAPHEPDAAQVQRCWTAGEEDDFSRLKAAIEATGIEQLIIQFHFSFYQLENFRHLLAHLQQQGIQVIMVLHSTTDAPWMGTFKSLRKLLPELHSLARIFVHGIEDLNRLKGFALIDNVSLYPHGVQRPHIDSRSLPDVTLVERLRPKHVVASYGFLMPHKGVKELIHAFILMRQRLPNLHLLLINAQYPSAESAIETEDCASLIRSHDLTDDVTLVTDFLSNEASHGYLSLADCIVYPYQQTHESSSAAVRWGIALEKPVFCTPLNIFEDVASAVQLLPGITPEQIASGLLAALSDPNVLQQKHAAQQAWLAQHDWHWLSQRLKGLLSGLQLSTLTATDANKNEETG